MNVLSSVAVTVVVTERSRYLNGMWSEFGLSLLIDCAWSDCRTARLLFDTSTSGDLLLRNLAALGVPVASIDMVILSHGHYDHTGGLGHLLAADGARFDLAAHTEVTRPVYSRRNGLRFIGLDAAVLNSLPSPRSMLLQEPVELLPNVYFSGTIARQTVFEKPEEGVWVLENGRLVPDRELDDAALAFDLGERGLLVVTGCCHAGLINTLLHLQQITGRDRLHAVFGGFHLVDLDQSVREQTVAALGRFDPQSVYSGHCTGWDAERMLADLLGGRYHCFYTGDRAVFRSQGST